MTTDTLLMPMLPRQYDLSKVENQSGYLIDYVDGVKVIVLINPISRFIISYNTAGDLVDLPPFVKFNFEQIGDLLATYNLAPVMIECVLVSKVLTNDEIEYRLENYPPDKYNYVPKDERIFGLLYDVYFPFNESNKNNKNDLNFEQRLNIMNTFAGLGDFNLCLPNNYYLEYISDNLVNVVYNTTMGFNKDLDRYYKSKGVLIKLSNNVYTPNDYNDTYFVKQ